MTACSQAACQEAALILIDSVGILEFRGKSQVPKPSPAMQLVCNMEASSQSPQRPSTLGAKVGALEKSTHLLEPSPDIQTLALVWEEERMLENEKCAF